MSAHVLLNLLNELGKLIRCKALLSILHQNVKISPSESVTFLWISTHNATT